MTSSMTRPDISEPDALFQQRDILQQWPTTVATGIMLLIVYYVWPWLAYETTIKRTLYEISTRMVPARFVRVLEKGASQIASLPIASSSGDGEQTDASGFSSVVQTARSLSGINKFIQPATETTFAGLGNWDNSCFQNSVLQGLASLQAFSRFVQYSWELCAEAKLNAPTHEGLHLFLAKLQQEVAGRHTVWPPSILRSMNTWQQQDAQEYYSRMMDALEKEARQYEKCMAKRLAPSLDCLRSGEGKEIAGQDREMCSKYLVHRLALSLLPANPVDGALTQILRCQTCGFSEGMSVMPFNCLTLNLGLGGHCSLGDLLDAYTEPELIEGVECDECTRLLRKSEDGALAGSTQGEGTDQTAAKRDRKVLSTKAKRILLGRLPRNLVIHINRSIFDDWGNQRKNTSCVEFPARLEIMDEWVASLESDNTKVHAVYELRCIVTHQGRHDNGHYIACGKRGKDWFSFNDEIVTKISEESVLSRGNVFMLFYEEIDRNPLTPIPEPGLSADTRAGDFLTCDAPIGSHDKAASVTLEKREEDSRYDDVSLASGKGRSSSAGNSPQPATSP